MKFQIKTNSLNFRLKNAVIKEYPELENIEITPSKEEQTFKSENYYGYDEVKVNGVTSEIDSNIKPENIKEGVEILGVSGNVEELNGEELTITKNGEYIPTEPINAYTKVIADVPNDTSDATATAGDIASGKTAYISSGLVEGTGNISTPVTKGVVINSYDADGYPTDISIVGLTEIPSYYFYSTMDTNGAIFSRAGANFRLSNNITSIGDRAFYGCYSLELTSLPESLTYIGGYAFHGCQNLKITSIPAGVTSLPSYCFRACNSLNELTILGDITSISSRAFETDANLEKVILPNVTSVPTLGSNVFNLTPISKGTGYIYVPDSLVDSFKSASNWSTYASQIKGISEL